MSSRTAIAFTALLAVIALAWGCSTLNVRHLVRQPWMSGKQQTLEMKYWRFEYTCLTVDGVLGVKGTAYPIPTVIPDNARWVADLWIGVYLSDAQGQVLAKDLRVYLPRTLDYKQGVDFEFPLKPQDVGGKGPLYVTFGYRTVLTPSENYAASEAEVHDPDNVNPNVFFCSEGALRN